MKASIKKTSVAFLVAIMFVFAGVMMTTGSFRASTSDASLGETSQPAPRVGNDGSGNGSIETPFLVGSQHTLDTIVRTNAGTANRHFRLINDITMTGNWNPITTLGNTSVFDGAGFTIHNFTTNGAGNRGLFATVAGGTVRNLNFENVSVTVSATRGGAVAGAASGNARFENIRVENGFVRGTNLTQGGSVSTSHTMGGLVGEVPSGTVRFENVFNGANIEGQYFLGGILGHGTSSSTITVINSMNTGTITARHGSFGYAGGIVGLTQSSVNITIDTAVNTGAVWSFNRDTAGILGMAWSGRAYIHNAINNSPVATNSGTRGAIVTRNSATVTITNSWFNNELVASNMQLIAPNQTSTTIVGSGNVDSAEMESQAFLDMINAGTYPPRFSWGPNGPEVRVLANRISIVFDANRGVFENGETMFTGDWEAGHTFIGNEVEEPTRIGFDFYRWNTAADGSGEYVDVEDIQTSTARTLFAQWTPINFVVDTTTHTDPGQTTRIYNGPGLGDGNPTTLSIYQTGFARTFFNVADANNIFIGWMALRNEGDPTDMSDWVNIGTGFNVPEGVDEYRLSFYQDGVYLIDEDFISNFVCEDTGIITIRAFFSDQTPITVNFDVGVGSADVYQRQFGTIRVDSTTRSFGSDVSFVYNQTAAFVLEITPNRFRTLEGILVNGVPHAGTIHEEDGVYTTDIVPVTGNDVRVIFGTQMFDFVVEASNPLADAGIQGFNPSATNEIGLGSTNLENPGISLQSVAGFRLVSPSANNIRIWNVRELRYDYFSAIGGNISFAASDLNENFFANYVQNGVVRIVAIFVRQFAINVTVNDQTMGRFDIVIIEPNGARHENPTTNIFDEGSEVTIILQPTEGASIGEIVGADGDINATRDMIIFTLGGQRDIHIDFEIRAFTLVVQALDLADRLIDSSVITTSTSVTDLSMGDTIANISFAEELSGLYAFRGWYAIVDGEPLSLTEAGFVAQDATAIVNLAFNQTFIDDFVDGFNLHIIARFEQVHSIQFEIIGNGTFTAQVMRYEAGEWEVDPSGIVISNQLPHSLPAGTRLLLTVTPASFYELFAIDNQETTNNTAILVVDGLRFIPIEFIREQITITTTMSLRGNGSMDTGTTSVSLGDVIMLTFNPTSGFELSTWRINGRDVDGIQDVTRSGNTVRITVTNEILEHLRNNNYTFTNNIETIMNRTFLFGMLAALIIIPLLALFITWMMVSNARKKKQYAALMQKRQQGSIMMGQSEALKKLRDGMNK